MKSSFYFLLLFLVFVTISLNFDNESFGLTEIKESKNVNFPEICGDQICGNVSEIRTSPLKQYKMGTPLNLIQCNDFFELILKQPTRKPACVLPDTAIKLIGQGWAVSKEEQSKIMSSFSEDNQIRNTISNTELSMTSKIINGEHYLIFEGSGWHNLHNVEITFSKDGEKITSIRSKTNDIGVLHMLWSIPNNMPNDTYQIHVTDGIHQKEVTFPILGNHIRFMPTSSDLKVEVNGEKQVRRGTTHSIEVQVSRDSNPIGGARVVITIEDYGENIIRKFEGHTNQEGYFKFSWEIPKSFDDIETLLAFVDVTDGISSKTNLFKFHVYCLPGEKNCKVEGN